jgi:hypothetical protein
MRSTEAGAHALLRIGRTGVGAQIPVMARQRNLDDERSVHRLPAPIPPLDDGNRSTTREKKKGSGWVTIMPKHDGQRFQPKLDRQSLTVVIKGQARIP